VRVLPGAVLAALVVLVPSGTRAGEGLAALEAAVHRRVNALRRSAGLLPLERDPALDRVARAHSRDMARRGYLAHVNPEGRTPLDRLRAAGVAGFTLAAENAGQSSLPDPAAEIVRGWVASPVHHRNLFLPAFNRTGIGVVRAADGTVYATQLYLSVPRAARSAGPRAGGPAAGGAPGPP